MVSKISSFDSMDLLKHTGLNPIRICLCSRYKTLDELCSLKKPIVCATEFESIAAKEFTERKLYVGRCHDPQQ